MKLSALYKFMIEKGIEKDPRGKQAVLDILKNEKKKYDKLSDSEKSEFDELKLYSPYADSRILFGTGEEEIKSLMVGIDIETPEIILADTLRRNGRKIDLALGHHPEGKAFATFYQVMDIHAEAMHGRGVPINIAEAISEPRMKEVGRRVASANHSRPVDAARLLNIPYMCIHTIADNHVNSYLQKYLEAKKPVNLDEVVKALKEIPEYRNAAKKAREPFILVGNKDRRAGKIHVDMTGGTEGHIDEIEHYARAGVGTIVGMHMSDDHFKAAEKHHVNVVLAGHISSDTLGLNLLFDSVEKKFGKLDIIECSGFERIPRK